MGQGPGEKEDTFAALFEQGAQAMPRRKKFHGGERVDVTVVAIGKESVFADIGGKEEGYFPRSSLLGDGGELAVAIGAKIAAVVTRVDDVSGQVELSPVYVRRASAEHFSDVPDLDGIAEVRLPVTSSAPLLVEGARVRGKVTGIERYGVFVQVQGTQGRGGRGLVPIAETGTPRGADLKKHFTVGQELDAKILNIAEDGKIRLSFSALKADEERAEFETFAKKERAPKDDAKAAQKPAVRGFGTFGDLFAKKKK